jgi:hypothetical protein
MTWHAQQVFADTHRQVSASLQQAFPGAVYGLLDLVEGVPERGLLVVRELCDPDSREGNWFRNRDCAVSWHIPADLADEESLAQVAVSVPNDHLLGGGSLPPPTLLAFLHRLSRSTGTVTSLYSASTWGGDWEHAYSWVFDGAAGADKIYVRRFPKDDVGGVQVWDPRRLDRPRETVVDGDVLALTLDHYGTHLDGGFFTPHTRSFDWKPWREAASGPA